MSAPPLTLDSAEAKLMRADRHRSNLERSLRRFRLRDPYVVVFDQQRARPGPGVAVPVGTDAFGLQVFADSYKYVDEPVSLEPKAGIEVPRLAWGVVIGDIVHNLCGALDNLAWAASEAGLAAGRYPATPADEKERESHAAQVHFPACLNEGDWKSVRGSALRFVPRDTQLLFQDYQPFAATPPGADPRAHPLAVIRRLWNLDKHRFVHTVVGAASLTGATALHLGAPDDHALRAETTEVHRGRAIQGRTEVGTVRVHLPETVTRPTTFNFHLTCHFALDILFEESSGVPGLSVRDVLLDARNLVARLLNAYSD